MREGWGIGVIVCSVIVPFGMMTADDKGNGCSVCTCRDDCRCDTISGQPGTCGSGTERKQV